MPSRRTLWTAWAVMTALTIVSLTAGRAGDSATVPLGAAMVAVVLAAGLFKASAILLVYLGLAGSAPGWRHGFHAGLALLAVLLWAAYAIPLPG